MSIQAILERIQQESIMFIDFRFTDTRGKEQHLSVPAHQINETLLSQGKMFDGSSMSGWQSINQSDMCLMPDLETTIIDPFYHDKTLIIRCDVYDPANNQPYLRDPRSIAKRAEQYLKTSGIADHFYIGPEPEFFILDEVKWKIDLNCASYEIDSNEAAWNTNSNCGGKNLGHRPSVKGGYFPVPPVDSSQNLRSAMSIALEKMGLVVEAHHHEVATGNQNEIATRFNTLVKKADEIQLLKYVVHNVANAHGKTATFMAKPLVGDNGSGMHCHQSLEKGGSNLFSGDKYEGLSDLALYFIGGILKHGKALNAFTNSTTNSYKRLVPGYEAPTVLSYSARNRSGAIRIPYTTCPRAKRIEARFPDASSNPYLAFSALLLAGLDGIKNSIHPGQPVDLDLYQLNETELKKFNSMAESLDEALEYLDKDRDFLTQGKVFSDDFIDSYIELKRAEATRLKRTTHPIEFDLYYSL